MKTVFPFVMLCFFSLPPAVEAASFDCTKANHPVEKAICGNDELSKLDDELAQIFQSRKAFVIQGDTHLVDEQKKWLSEMRKECKADNEIDKCVKRKYRLRIDGDLRLLPFSASIAPPKGDEEKFVWLKDMLPEYDLKLALEPAPVCDENFVCSYERLLSIFPKGQKNPRQAIVLPYEIGQHNLSEMTDKLNQKQLFEVVDYNFDGCPDFAVYTGIEGIRGAKEYRVFLCNKKDGKFYYAPAFSDMIYAQVVERDKENKKYKVFDRASCCQHYSIIYKVENNIPIPVFQTIRDSMNSEKEGEYFIFRDEVWKNGAWQMLRERRSTSGDFETP